MKKVILAIALILTGSAGSVVVFDQMAAYAACPSGKILTLKPWYDGLVDADCNVRTPGSSADDQAKFVWHIVLNIVDDMFQIIGYVATGYIMYGGFFIMTSAGSPDKAARGRKIILNASVGLIVVLASIGIVNLAAGALGL